MLLRWPSFLATIGCVVLLHLAVALVNLVVLPCCRLAGLTLSRRLSPCHLQHFCRLGLLSSCLLPDRPVALVASPCVVLIASPYHNVCRLALAVVLACCLHL